MARVVLPVSSRKVADAGKKVSFETPAGIIAAQLHGELVTLNMSERLICS